MRLESEVQSHGGSYLCFHVDEDEDEELTIPSPPKDDTEEGEIKENLKRTVVGKGAPPSAGIKGDP